MASREQLKRVGVRLVIYPAAPDRWTTDVYGVLQEEEPGGWRLALVASPPSVEARRLEFALRLIAGEAEPEGGWEMGVDENGVTWRAVHLYVPAPGALPPALTLAEMLPLTASDGGIRA